MNRLSSLTDNDSVPDSVRDLFEKVQAAGMTPVQARDFLVFAVEYVRKKRPHLLKEQKGRQL